jgi:hypothetical protein
MAVYPELYLGLLLGRIACAIAVVQHLARLNTGIMHIRGAGYIIASILKRCVTFMSLRISMCFAMTHRKV